MRHLLRQLASALGAFVASAGVTAASEFVPAALTVELERRRPA